MYDEFQKGGTPPLSGIKMCPRNVTFECEFENFALISYQNYSKGPGQEPLNIGLLVSSTRRRRPRGRFHGRHQIICRWVIISAQLGVANVL